MANEYLLETVASLQKSKKVFCRRATYEKDGTCIWPTSNFSNIIKKYTKVKKLFRNKNKIIFEA
jgi:hypothetical protein